MKVKNIKALIRRVVYETRTCPETIGMINTYPKYEGNCPTEEAEKCVKCFYYALANN